MSNSQALAEQITAYFATLPCPPLPILATKPPGEAEDAPAVPRVASSHDLLAQMLLLAMQQNNKELNERRKGFQQDATHRLVEALNAKPEPCAERIYYLFQCFTADYISSFAAQPQGVHYADVQEVTPGTHLFKAMCSWSAAQDILHLPKEERRTAKEHYSKMSYQEMVLAHCARVRGILGRGENPWLPEKISAKSGAPKAAAEEPSV